MVTESRLALPADTEIQPTAPFLKWAGGKRWLFRKHRDLFPSKIHSLVDPFLGGGASIFYLNPANAVVSDINADLIVTYEVVRDQPHQLTNLILQHHQNHSLEYYYSTRSSKPTNDRLALAAWFIYLNRTCWNGLYRVNLKGDFNVPKGTKTKVFLSRDEFPDISRHISTTIFRVDDFEDTIENAAKGDVIFADPPYFESPDSVRFVKYHKDVFSWVDQLRLKDCLVRAQRRGARCYLTNANDEALNTLYAGVGAIRELRRPMVVAGKSGARRQDGEILVELK